MTVVNPGGGGASVPAFAFGTAAARPAPAAGNANTGYYATDTGEVTFSNGAAWNAIKGTSVATWQLALGAGGNFPVMTFVNSTRTDFGNQNVENAIQTSNGNVLFPQGSVDVSLTGQGLKVAEGSNAKQGVATLAAGTVVVPNTSVTATSRILLTPQDNNTAGALRVSARTAGTSFTITSSNGADTGVVAWQIFEVG